MKKFAIFAVTLLALAACKDEPEPKPGQLSDYINSYLEKHELDVGVVVFVLGAM